MKLALRTIILVGVATAMISVCMGTAWAKSTRFWNLTANTITNLALAPAGTTTFGPDLAKMDPDGSVEHDERIKVTVPSGTYDAKITDNKGRTCIVKGVAVKEGEVFSIDEQQLADCGK